MYAQKELGQPIVGWARDRGSDVRWIDLEPLCAWVCAGRLHGQEFENRFSRRLGLIGRE
jgi:hypothetical protein